MNQNVSFLLSSLSSASRVALTTACAALCVACGPRGESHTLDQVFSDARSEYNGVSNVAVAADVSTSLKKISSDLDRLAGIGGAGDAKDISKGVADALSPLIGKSGMTQRASMTELVNQYRAIGAASDSAVSVGAPQLKLLVARTYNILHSELISTQFKL